MLTFILRRLLVRRRPRLRDLGRRLHAALPRQRRHRPPHPRPERHAGDRRPEGRGARPRPAAPRPVLGLADLRAPGDLGRSWFTGQLVAVERLGPPRGHALDRDRRDPRRRDHLRRPRRPRRPSRRLGRRHRAVHLRARLRDPGLPHRPLPRADLRDQPALVQGDRVHPVHDLAHPAGSRRSPCRSSPSRSAPSPRSRSRCAARCSTRSPATTCARSAAAASASNRVVYKHVLRNAGGPALAILARAVHRPARRRRHRRAGLRPSRARPAHRRRRPPRATSRS